MYSLDKTLLWLNDNWKFSVNLLCYLYSRKAVYHKGQMTCAKELSHTAINLDACVDTNENRWNINRWHFYELFQEQKLLKNWDQFANIKANLATIYIVARFLLLLLYRHQTKVSSLSQHNESTNLPHFPEVSELPKLININWIHHNSK